MTDAVDLERTIAAAEEAANAGDYPLAERHLGDALRMQETALGPGHPDLANTLNNLGVIYERTERFDEAESAYRRAYAIARAALPADHPFVTTSATNLREFCNWHDRPFDVPEAAAAPSSHAPAPSAPAVASLTQTANDPAATTRVRTAASQPSAPAPAADTMRAPAADTVKPGDLAAPRTSPAPVRAARPFRARAMALAVVIAVGVLAVWMFLRRDPASSNADATDVAANTATAEPTRAAPAPEAAEPEPPPSSSAATALPDNASAPPAVQPASPSSVTPSPRADTSASPTRGAARAPVPTSTAVVVATVCRRLSTNNAAGWQCDEVDGPVAPGSLTFYTRIRSPRATTVEHRWYRGNELRQRVELRVSANTGPGYRTYSRHTIAAGNGGAWRVEVRDAAGTVLASERFTVR